MTDKNFSITVRFIDPSIPAQARITCYADTLEDLFDRAKEARAHALAVENMIDDRWPFVSDDERLPKETPEEQAEILQEAYPKFATPAQYVNFMASDAFTALDKETREKVMADFAKCAHRLNEKSPNKEAVLEQPADLIHLYDAEGSPLYSLPRFADPGELPAMEQRPARWCPLHNEWMWERRDANGGVWYSHPFFRGGKRLWCRGKERGKASAAA